MKLYGLIGYPLSHSFSQSYFRAKFKDLGLVAHDYLNFSIEDINEVSYVLDNNPSLLGFNVTIPHKEHILKYLNEIDNAAKQIGAVNTVKISKKNNQIYLKGYNTDVYGFQESLKPLLSDKHQHALILGTGGASKAVAFVLQNLNINFTFVSRKSIENYSISYAKVNELILKTHTLIINTTPLGMFPQTESFPDIPYQFISSNHLLFDLVYNPTKTAFLKKGEDNGATIANGHRMLELQAEKAWEIFKSA